MEEVIILGKVTIVSMQNELAERERLIEQQKNEIHKLINELHEKQKKNEQQAMEIQRLKNEMNDFLSELYWQGSKNERNAGRRSIITEKLKGDVRELRHGGKSFKDIASDLKISVGTAHNVYNRS
jgi:predicted RNase H-like nuclease (RuvC/YqgF family)